MEITIRPTVKQHLVYQALKDPSVDEVFFGGGAGGGKSWMICESRLVNSYLYPGYRSFIAREELKRLMESTYVTWLKVCQYHKIPKTEWKLNGQYNYIEFLNGSRIDLLDVKFLPSDPLYERYGSTEYSDGALEEAGEIHPLARDVLKSRINRHLNKELGIIPNLLDTGNPKKNWTYQVFYKPWKEGRLPLNMRFIQALYNDNPYTSDDYGKTLSLISDRTMRERLRDGNWDYDEDKNTMVSFNALSDAFTNTITKDNQKYLIIDVSRFGWDTTVFSFWDGLELYRIEVRQGQSIENTKQQARDFAAIERIPYSNILIDEDGIGGGVVDGLPGVKGFIANSQPLPTATEIRQRQSKIDNFLIPKRNFHNLKSQCAFKLAELINEHKIAFKVPNYRESITEELSALLKQKNIDSDNKLQIISKDEVKEALGRSPDIGDTIIYRVWFELQKDALNEDPNRNNILNKQREMMAERNQSLNSTK